MVIAEKQKSTFGNDTSATDAIQSIDIWTVQVVSRWCPHSIATQRVR